MALGVMHDLAVGVSPRGVDAWSLQDTYARNVSVGCPPDPFNHKDRTGISHPGALIASLPGRTHPSETWSPPS
jgi:hypothetical protein